MSTEKVLVTGATGFLATHIVDLLLSKGYEIIGTARSEAKYKPLLNGFNMKYPEGKLTYEIVEEIGAANAFDDVLKKHGDISHVLHTASPFAYGIGKSPEEAFKIPAVQGTRNILQAIKDYGHNVKHVVITSSFAVITELDESLHPVYTEKSWTSLTWDMVGDSEMLGYCCSKKLAEETAWDFVKTESPNFALTTIIPPYMFGPQVFDFQVGKSLNLSNQMLLGVLAIDPSETKAQKQMSGVYLDVRDAALVHIAPLSTTTMNNKRVMAAGGKFCAQDILNAMNQTSFLKGKVAIGDPSYCDTEEYRKSLKTIDNSESIKLLGDINFNNLNNIIADTFLQYYKVNNLMD
ncbi:hypothetical protein B5S32_g1636 [[Candida] boidinii]|nr:hypothetical protein B5S32_g1636 [[Candida] boidinii]